MASAGLALGLMGAFGAAGSLGGAAIQSSEAGNAAQAEQAAAAKVTQQAQQAAQAASTGVNTATGTANTGINTAVGVGNTGLAGGLSAQEAALAPYLQAGVTSLPQLQAALTSLSAPGNQFSFNPTTSPQLIFEQQQANQALQRSAAAQGTVLGGGTVRASDIMNTGLASTYIDQAFNQALSQYTTNRQNVLSTISGLQGLAGGGLTAAGYQNQDIGTEANLAAQNTIQGAQLTGQNTIGAAQYSGNAGLTAAQIAEQATIGAANAQAASDLASGRAWGGAASSLGSSASQLYGLSQGINPYAPGGGYGLGGNGSPASIGINTGNIATNPANNGNPTSNTGVYV